MAFLLLIKTNHNKKINHYTNNLIGLLFAQILIIRGDGNARQRGITTSSTASKRVSTTG
jgi:hypothetical protein